MDDNDDQQQSSVDKRNARLRQELDTLQQEMEIAEHATNKKGQYRKKLPRKQSRIRTKKRKLLEVDDRKKHAVEGDVSTTRRRGAARALEEDIVQESAIFRGSSHAEEEEEAYIPDDEEEDEGYVDDDMEELGASTPKRGKASPAAAPKKRKKRLMYRMRNFKSQRMALRHGDALGAHARGDARVAISKLKEVAADAPDAPQVYSSLGMVYEDLLLSSKRKRTAENGQQQELGSSGLPQGLEEEIEIAKKAYGSYHAAAALCKKDFTLWVRAADSASEIAQLYAEVMSTTDQTRVAQFRALRKKWTEDAKRDYQIADNLKPPGIDVPAKLAAVQMDLVNLSEALTILTDLKNRGSEKAEDGIVHRTEFAKSYKSWLLYADLMLRIGYECSQWNKGIRTNENYMFKRWMRKYSKLFDWQERRLQALIMAFEAAAGTQACSNLVAWATQRATQNSSDDARGELQRWHMDNYEDGKEVAAEKKRGDKKGRQNENGEPKDEDEQEEVLAASDFESSRSALIAKNKAELEAFDQVTRELALSEGSNEAVEGESQREMLVKQHKAAVVALVGQHAVEQRKNTAQNASDLPDPLPLVASCSVVCSVASELIKCCLGFNLFTGGRLVGDAVSSYLRQRAASRDKRLEANQRFENRQQSTDREILLGAEAYDEVRGEESDQSDDEWEGAYPSDDEVINAAIDESLVLSLRTGTLPSELQLLYALSLIGEGGRDFAATKAIQAINSLDDSDLSSGNEIDTDIVSDPAWRVFRATMTEPLGKVAAFAFVADFLRKLGKEREWSCHLAPLFKNHVSIMQADGRLGNALVHGVTLLSPQSALVRTQTLKSVTASGRLSLAQAETLLESGSVPEVVVICVELVKQFGHIAKLLWSVDMEDGSVAPPCNEALEIVSRALSVLRTCQSKSDSVDASTSEIMAILKSLLSAVTGVTDESALEESIFNETPAGLTSFPILSDWQTDKEEALSIQALNLAVGCRVANFSGWNRENFHLGLLKRTADNRYFGIVLHNGRVAGPISKEAETMLSDQWRQLQELFPDMAPFDFSSELQKTKVQASWYEHRDDTPRPETIASFGEEDGLSLFLVYAGLCLDSAESASTPSMKNELLRTALSIMLPISQLCLERKIWISDIGKTASSGLNGIDGWRNDSRDSDWKRLLKKSKPPTANGPKEASRGRAEEKKMTSMEKARDEWASGHGREAITKMVRLSSSELLAEWTRDLPPSNGNTRVISNAAKEAVKAVELSMHVLRKCSTETAAQKACLDVAITLLELSGMEECNDPIHYLHQAAIYASQCPKGANQDEHFKTSLPMEQECTAREALVILGRADCLQSLHFPMEATYLCNYVARVCQMHRDRTVHDLEWTTQWKVVGIVAYTTSVLIRVTTCTTLGREAQQKVFKSWDLDLIDEIDRGRADALALKRSSQAAVGTVYENSSEAEEEKQALDESNASNAPDADPASHDGELYAV